MHKSFMNERDENRLRDMLDAAERALKFTDGKVRADLEANDTLLGFALVRVIEVIGEAASKISPETRAECPGISWTEIIGMRNRIVHDYLNVDYDIVWQVTVEDLPPMIAALHRLLDDISS